MNTLANQDITGVAVAVWLGIAAFVAAVLGVAGCWRPSTLRRGPLREVDWSFVDLLLGFALVGMIFLDKLLIDLGGAWFGATWSDAEVNNLRALASLGLLLGAAYFVIKTAMTDAGWRKAGLVPRRPGRDLVVSAVGLPAGVVLTFATLVVVNYVAVLWGDPSPEVNHGMLEQLQEAKRTGDLAKAASIIGLAVLLGPLLEELVFRGLLQTLLLEVMGRAARWSVIIVASMVFASVHYGATTWHALPGLFVLGVVLGWTYERTGSLLPAFLIHAGFNAINIAYVWNS